MAYVAINTIYFTDVIIITTFYLAGRYCHAHIGWRNVCTIDTYTQ